MAAGAILLERNVLGDLYKGKPDKVQERNLEEAVFMENLKPIETKPTRHRGKGC